MVLLVHAPSGTHTINLAKSRALEANKLKNTQMQELMVMKKPQLISLALFWLGGQISAADFDSTVCMRYYKSSI